MNSQHKGQWCRALMLPLIYAWINGWADNREAGDLRYHRAHYDVTGMEITHPKNYTHGFRFVPLFCSSVQVSFTHIIQDYCIVTGAIILLPQYQWNNLKIWINKCHLSIKKDNATTTKQNYMYILWDELNVMSLAKHDFAYHYQRHRRQASI